MLKKRLSRTILVTAVITMFAIGLAGCSPVNAGNPQTPVKQVSIDVQVTGDTVTIPQKVVDKNLNTRFSVTTEKGELTFMAYIWDGKLNVRADICPPCGSKSFTLVQGTLVCDACGTVFDATSGRGVSGPCRIFAKEAASYQLVGESIIVSTTDLLTAYKETLLPN